MASVRHTAEFRRTGTVQVEEVRGHRAIKGIPYVPRDCESDVKNRLQHRRVLIAGAAMTGKTRLALQLTRDIFPDHGFVDARDGTALRAMLEVEPAESNLVVWLDDLVRFLGTDAVTRDVLDLLHARGNVVVGTIGSASYDDLITEAALKPAGWGVPAWFGEPVRLTGWSEREFERAARRRVPEQTLASARRFGLSASVGGGPVLLRRFRAGNTTQPVGCAVVRAAADWGRTGTSAPLSRAGLLDLVPAYLVGAPGAVGPDALPTGLSWARTHVNGVALLQERDSGFDVLDYVQDHLDAEGWPIPPAVWDAAIAHPQVTARDLIDIGFQAAIGHGRSDVAIAAYRLAAGGPDSDLAAVAERSLKKLGAPTRGVVKGRADLPVRPKISGDALVAAPPHRDFEVEAAATQAMPIVAPAPPSPGAQPHRAVAGDSHLDVGIHREGHGDFEGAADAYQRAIDSRHPDHAPKAAVLLGLLRRAQGHVHAAAAAYQMAIDSGHSRYAEEAGRLAAALRDEIDVDKAPQTRPLRAVSRNVKDAPKAAFDLGMYRLGQRDLDGAMAAWHRALESGHPEHAPAAALRMASLYIHRADSASAIKAYQIAIDSGHPDHAPEAALGLGGLRHSQGDLDSAIAAYKVAVDSGHATYASVAAERLSALDGEQDRFEQAAADHRAIEAADPDEAPRAALRLALLCQSRNDAAGEVAAYQVAIEYGHPETLPIAAYNLGVLRKKAGQLALAAAAWALAIGSGDATYAPMAAYNLGILRRDSGEIEAAVAAWRIAVSSGDPEFAPAAALELAELWRDQGDLESAAALWRMILEAGHAEYAPSAAFNLGALLQDWGDVDGAVAAWQYTIDSRHLDSAPEAALRLAHLRRAQGDLHRAAASYQLAIDSGHEHVAPKAAIYLGLLLEEHGDVAGAAAAYQIAIDSDHETEATEAALRLGMLMDRRGDVGAAAAAYQVAVDSTDPVHSMHAATFLENLANGVSMTAGGSDAAETFSDLSQVLPDGRDVEYPFLSADQGRWLRDLVRDAFLVRGVDVRLSPGYAEATDGTLYDLADVADRCHNAPGDQRDWGNIVNDHVAFILDGQTPDPLDSLSVEEVFSRAFLRVYDRASLGEGDGYSYARPVVGKLVELLVLDLDDKVQILHRAQLERLDWNALHSAALAHLLGEPIDDYAVFTDNGGTIHVAYGQSPYIASKLLILPDVLARTIGKREPPFGVLVAVPNVHEIAFHPIVDQSVVPSIEQLSVFAAQSFSEEDGSVSPFVYWWQQGRLTQMTRFDDGGQVVLDVDDAFQQVLNGLIGGAGLDWPAAPGR